jgi:hypothetical protein
MHGYARGAGMMDVLGRKRVLAASLAALLFGLAACRDDAEQAIPSPDPADPAGLAEHTSSTWTGVIPADDDCASIEAWIAANEIDLPTGYDDIVQFPAAYRRAIFDILSPAEQSSLWQQHFQAYLAANPGLTAEQIAFIHEASAAASPAFFADHAGAASGEDPAARAHALEAEATMLFAEDELHSLLASLGPEDPALEAVAARRVRCHCSTDSDWCNRRGDGLRCRGGAAGCERHGGCGTLFRFTCNGLCGP